MPDSADLAARADRIASTPPATPAAPPPKAPTADAPGWHGISSLRYPHAGSAVELLTALHGPTGSAVGQWAPADLSDLRTKAESIRQDALAELADSVPLSNPLAAAVVEGQTPEERTAIEKQRTERRRRLSAASVESPDDANAVLRGIETDISRARERRAERIIEAIDDQIPTALARTVLDDWAP